MATFDRQQLLLALNGLVDELVAGQVAARIRVVGGAAIVLAHDPGRGATRDVDALVAVPRDEVLAAVRRIAEREGWPMDWLNTDAQMYSPDPDHPEPAWEVLIERNGVAWAGNRSPGEGFDMRRHVLDVLLEIPRRRGGRVTLATDILWTPDPMSRVGATLPG